MINYKSFTNLVWNGVNGVIIGILSFVFTPLYIEIVGLEDYAFINIWIISNVIIGVFDLGINLTINNTIASKKYSVFEKNNIFLSYESILFKRVLYFILTLLLTLALLKLLLAKFPFYLLIIIILISISVIFQFLSYYYYNVFFGLFRHRQINQYNISINILRYFLGFVLLFYSSSVIYFLSLQLLISLIQFIIIRISTFKTLGINFNRLNQYKYNSELLRKNYRFHLTILSISSLILAHLDRLWSLVDNTLQNYSTYVIAFTAAGLLQLIIQPFYKTFFPKYSSFFNNKKDSHILLLNSIIISSSFLTLVGLIMILHSELILSVWLGDIYSGIINNHFILIVMGLTVSGYFWLPAAYMQAVQKPQFHNKMILLSILAAIPAFTLNKLEIIEFSPAVIWIIHGLILLIFEGYHLYKNYLKKKINSVLVFGIILPILIVLSINYFLQNLFQSNLLLLQLILTFIFSSLILLITLYKKKIIYEAFK